jgi:hypothetical protein
MILPVRDHTEIVKDGTKEDDDLRIIIGHLMIRYNVRFDVSFEQIAEYFECDIRDDCKMDGTVIRETHSSNGVDVDAFPEALQEVVVVDSVKN